MKQISKITNAQISSRGVQALADKPNATSQYGVAGLSPAGLKQWFDQLASFIAQKVNTIIDTLSADDCAEYIKVVLDNSDYESLDDVLKSFESGEFASELVKLYPSVTSNTLTTLQSVINTIASSISTLTEGLNNAVYRLDHNTLVPVESTLSETSTNTIQNKVVAKALNKQNSGSATTHTLTTRAGGIELQRVVGESHKSKNLLNPTLATTTKNVVTFANNGDGTYNVSTNGSTTDSVMVNLQVIPSAEWNMWVGQTLKLCGNVDGGGTSTYLLYVQGSFGNYAFCTNKNGTSFTVPNSTTDVLIKFQVYTNVTCNIVIKPMLTTDTSATYNDYEPYGIHSSGSMGCVDMSTLTWVYQDTIGLDRFWTRITNMVSAEPNVAKVFCDTYDFNMSPLTTGNVDLSIATESGRVFVRDTTVTSVQALTEKLNGVYLAYEPSSTPSAYALPITEHNADSTQTHSVVIPLTEPLYKDNEICKQGGKWGVLKKYASVDLGTLSWTRADEYWYSTSAELFNSIKRTGALADNFLSAYQIEKIACVSGNIIRLYSSNSSTSPSGILVYELATPTFTPFTDQKPCYQLESFDGQTVITSDGLAKLSVGYGTSDVMALTLKSMNDIAILKEGE